MSAGVAGTTFRPNPTYTTLRDVTHRCAVGGCHNDVPWSRTYATASATGESRPVAYRTIVGGSARRLLPFLGDTGRRLGCIDMHERSTGDARAGAGLWRILDV